MSELTICNYCSWKRKKEIYKKQKRKVILKPSKKMPGWIAATENNEEIGWYQEMPNRCCC